MKTVRVFYKKKGRMKFVSHLDMTRFMARLITKAKIPVWYTEGFHTHLYMNFALPLSLGYESDYEIMDIRLTDDTLPLESCLEALKVVAPTDIEFTNIIEGGSAMKNIGFARYELEIENFTFSQQLNEFLSRPTIICKKTGKKGKIKEIDLIPKIRAFEITEKGVELTLAAGSEDNLNPSLVMSVFFEENQMAPRYYTVNRTMIYDKEGNQFK